MINTPEILKSLKVSPVRALRLSLIRGDSLDFSQLNSRPGFPLGNQVYE